MSDKFKLISFEFIVSSPKLRIWHLPCSYPYYREENVDAKG